MEIESLTAGQILELIELSFYPACYALSKGDRKPLELFVVAVATASQKYGGLASASAISESVDSLPPSARPLDDTERSLRDTWIRAVYLMMGHVNVHATAPEGNFPGGDDDAVAATYGPILADLVAIHQTGMGLNANRFVASRRDVLFPPRENTKPATTNILALDDDDDEEHDADPVQLAVVTQTINVLYATLVVLEDDDEDEASDEDDDSAAAIDASGGEEERSPASNTKKKKKTSTNSSGSSGRGFG